MNVTILNTLYKYGGAEQAARDLFFGLKDNNVKTNFLHRQELHSCPKDTIKVPSNRIDYFLTNKKPYLIKKFAKDLLTPSSFTRLPNILKNINPDIIHLHNLHDANCDSSISYWPLLSLHKKYPILWTLHDGKMMCNCSWFKCDKYLNHCWNCQESFCNQKMLYIFLTKYIKNHIHRRSNFHIITPSLWLKNKINNVYDNKLKIHHIPYGINTDIFKPIKDAKEKINIPRNKKVILFLSANIDEKRKGFSYLAKALQDINLKNIHLLAIGNKPKNNTNLPIHFTGYIERNNLPLYYSAADIFVSPTLADNLPFTILESMSCKTSVIASSVGGVSEEINHKKTGLLVPPKDSKKLAKTITFLLKNNKARINMGENSRMRVTKLFSKDLHIKRHLKLYKAVLNQK